MRVSFRPCALQRRVRKTTNLQRHVFGYPSRTTSEKNCSNHGFRQGEPFAELLRQRRKLHTAQRYFPGRSNPFELSKLKNTNLRHRHALRGLTTMGFVFDKLKQFLRQAEGGKRLGDPRVVAPESRFVGLRRGVAWRDHNGR